ncbi:MAG TPA: hypothetical protein PKI19_08255 [Elusimicrobiales bacterium]|nr:hypothetical protein [Elusimicrobiales bacterium]
MKYIFYFLLAFPVVAAHSAEPAPCAKDADACSASGPRSAFLEAAKAAPAPAAARPGKTGKDERRRPAAVEASSAAAAAVTAAASEAGAVAAAQRPAASSNPLWVLFAAGGLAGLYLYLKSDAGKRRPK